MRMTDKFIVSPLNGEKFLNTKQVGDKTLITNTSIEHASNVNRIGVVVSLPMNYEGNIKVDDHVVVQHNIFRTYFDGKGKTRESDFHIKDDLFQIPKDNLDQKIQVFHKSLKTMDPKVLGKPSGVSYINKCIAGKAEGIFSPLAKNTKQNSRAAIVYNDLLKFKKLDKKFEGFVEGDRVFIINLIGNPYKMKVIGLPNAKIPEEIKGFVDEYVDRDAIFESMICKKLRELYSDLKWDFPSLNENVGKFFKFN